MNPNFIPRTPVTFTLASVMTVVYLLDPVITELTYISLAPWMHAGWSHFCNNLLIFILLGVWTERRLGWLTFLFFAFPIPYLSLYAPVAFGYDGLSRGASGLTMALTGYAVPVLLTTLIKRLESFDPNWREVGHVGLHLLVVSYLITDAFVTVKRFIGFSPRPEGVAVSAHFTALALGVLWFAWRGYRHGVFDA